MSGIIVGIDGSTHSERALEWAVHEAAIRQVPLRVITVFRRAVSHWGAGAITDPQEHAIAMQARESAQDAVDKALAHAGDARPKSVTVDALGGIPAEELVNASKDADMIVVGSRGAGGFARLLLGSVGSQVVHHAHCPIVIIPAEERHH
jgi:nucleotide-binding universal stress UspA family protein